jgi:rod shape determining protein RodA
MLFREGLPGGVLLFGIVIVILLVLSLIMAKIYLIAGIILLGYIAFAIYSKQYKITSLGFLIFAAITAIIWGATIATHKKIENYYTLAISFSIAGFIFLIITFFRRIKFVAAFVLFLLGAVIFSFSVDIVFHHGLSRHQQQRINILLGLESDPLGRGYNINQSKIAIGSGGVFGKGFLQGTQTKFNFVPEQSTDFIFCTVGEEWGFLGTTTVLGLFLFLLIRIVIIAERQRSVFSRVYAYSVASILFFHVAINVGMAIDVLPVIGIPLPFFSAGGSSLWSFTILLFILLRLDASRLELLK